MVSTNEDADSCLARRIVAEYLEMPGLALTVAQAQRLWGCDRATCRQVTDMLVAKGVLRWTREGRLVRSR
jgi:Fic family protein